MTWNGSIAVGGSVIITITAKVNTGTAGQTICNQGTISYDSNADGTNDASGVTDNPAHSGGGRSDRRHRTAGRSFPSRPSPSSVSPLSAWPSPAPLCSSCAAAARPDP